jgi:hypothetical protein
MSRSISVCLCALVALAAFAGALGFHPSPVLAASGTLSTDTPLHDAPDPAAPVIALLSAGTRVSIDGPPVEGFYPVTAGDLAGWMRGETLQLEKDTPAPAATEGTDAAPPVDDTDLTIPVEANAAAEVAGAPTIDPTVMPIPVPAVASVGLTSVAVDAPILAGPGPEYGFIATAPAGSTVEQTGHVINGYATVQYAEVTGWLALEHLGVPGTLVDQSLSAETAPVEAPLVDAPLAETSLTETTSSDTPLAQTAPLETPPVETPPEETARTEAAPVDAASADVVPVAAT